MRKRYRLCAALAAGALCGLAQAQNLLTNPDLDTAAVSTQVLPTPVSWNCTATRSISGPFTDGMSSEGFCNVLQPGGLGLFFKPFQGNATDGTLSATMNQSVGGGVPGKTYVLKGWAGAGAGYIGLTDPTVKSEFRLQFLNSSFTVIGDNILDLKAAGLGTGTADPPASGFAYHNFAISAVAPAGTLFVRAQADMLGAYGNPAGGDQAFVVDSFALYVPEPGSLAMLSLGGLFLIRRRTA